jgi:hypothetical protein
MEVTMKYKAVIATTSIDLQDSRFTKEALVSAKESFNKEVPVSIEFKAKSSLGDIKQVDIENDNLVATFELRYMIDASHKKIMKLLENSYLVPGGILEEYHTEEDITVIDKFKITSCAITKSPADMSLTEIEIIE